MANIIKLGSILLDGVHTEPGSEYQPGQAIGFGGRNDLQWVIVNGLLIADRPVLVNISWDHLNDQKLVFGKQVTINGQRFLCRLLKVGADKGVQNEWDAALDVVGDDNETWHWKNQFFWGRERVDVLHRTVRGYFSARYWDYSSFDYQSVNTGFRPALVHLPSDNLISGSEVCAIGGQSLVRGTLLETTDYDAIIRLSPTSMMAAADKGKCYSQLQNTAGKAHCVSCGRMSTEGTVILDRTSMIVQPIKEK